MAMNSSVRSLPPPSFGDVCRSVPEVQKDEALVQASLPPPSYSPRGVKRPCTCAAALNPPYPDALEQDNTEKAVQLLDDVHEDEVMKESKRLKAQYEDQRQEEANALTQEATQKDCKH
eukprot:comp23134_c0_seq1/m.37312 comp23134_c0_seq1/g.37312  ORF comp23134_c0_seq1/g.37312 comp23134_c0_seq1/m.37312 type:complete len:118 (-) comp23134_c0_seq1:1404-1757(-)